MRKLSPLVLAAIALLPHPVLAQQISPALTISQGNTLLTLSGEGKSLQTPDLALFTAGVTTQGKTAAEALSANSSAMDRVIAQLRAAGIVGRDIQTSNLNVEPVYSDPNREAAMAAR